MPCGSGQCVCVFNLTLVILHSAQQVLLHPIMLCPWSRGVMMSVWVTWCKQEIFFKEQNYMYSSTLFFKSVLPKRSETPWTRFPNLQLFTPTKTLLQTRRWCCGVRVCSAQARRAPSEIHTETRASRIMKDPHQQQQYTTEASMLRKAPL